MTITARYEHGVFRPLEDVSIHEGTIVEVRIPSYAERLKEKSPPIGDSEIFGMWSDHTDLGGSVDYVNSLRRNIRG